MHDIRHCLDRGRIVFVTMGCPFNAVVLACVNRGREEVGG